MKLQDLRDYEFRTGGSKPMGMSLIIDKDRFETLKDISDYVIEKRGKDLWYTNAFYPVEVEMSMSDKILRKKPKMEIILYYNPRLPSLNVD